jgi:hypothetical protein
MGKGEARTGLLVWKPEGIRPLGISRRRQDTKINLQEVGCVSVDWMDLAQDGDRWQALMNAVMNHLVP